MVCENHQTIKRSYKSRKRRDLDRETAEVDEDLLTLIIQNSIPDEYNAQHLFSEYTLVTKNNSFF